MAVAESLGLREDWVVASGADRGGCAEVELPGSFIVKRKKEEKRERVPGRSSLMCQIYVRQILGSRLDLL